MSGSTITTARLVLALLLVALVSFFATPLVFDDGELGLTLAAQDGEGEAADDGAAEEPSAGELLDALPFETTQVYLARDPFRPVRPDTSTGGDGGDGTTGTGGDGTGGTTGDGTDGDTSTPGAGVEVVGVFESDSGDPMAIISFEGVLYTVGEGDTFADRFVVVTIDLDTGCVDMLEGDDAFSACVGDGQVGGGDPSEGCSAGTSSASCEGRDVRLVDITTEGGETAYVSVDGTVYEVGEGDRFAENFEVVSIDDPCVRLLYGDDGFTLCIGDTVLK